MKKQKYFMLIGVILTIASIFPAFILAQNSFDQCILLDGSQNYISIPHIEDLNLGETFTIEICMRLNDDNPATLLNKWTTYYDFTGEPGPQGWGIYLNCMFEGDYMDSLVHAPGGFMIKTARDNYDGSGGSTLVFGGKRFEMGKWYHLAMPVHRYEGGFTLYINGIEEITMSNLFDEEEHTPDIPLNVGGFQKDIDSTLYLDGLIDELRIWNTERTVSQFLSTMNDTLAPIYYATQDSGLIAYYRFDQLEDLGIGDDSLIDDIRDFSVNANHADIVGNPLLIPSDMDLSTDIDSQKEKIPRETTLFPNYPNPFNSSTTIGFNLQKSCFVKLIVFNLLGHEIETLVSEQKQPGEYEIKWTAKGLPGGIYLYRLEAGEFMETRKLILLR